ncbi:MAG: GNAT family N-acetyltransferase [Anaerolineae bacterium]|nr:GNAT family N-acetyltransferase [Anaerolineae bacterium]
MTYSIRPFKPEDRTAIDACDFTFTTKTVLSLQKTVRGVGATWSLTERELEGQYMGNYALADHDWEYVLQRQTGSPSLLCVAETEGKPVALLDVSLEEWNETARIWNLYVDAAHRANGLGKQLIARATAWAREPEHKARALVVETQTHNWAACNFYKSCGFELCGIDDHFYSNNDAIAKMGIGEVALFWYLALSS